MARKREEDLREVFNEAAADVTESDRAEREVLLSAFSVNENPAGSTPNVTTKAKPRAERKRSRWACRSRCAMRSG